jgi:hypothetical protein
MNRAKPITSVGGISKVISIDDDLTPIFCPEDAFNLLLSADFGELESEGKGSSSVPHMAPAHHLVRSSVLQIPCILSPTVPASPLSFLLSSALPMPLYPPTRLGPSVVELPC